MKLHNYRIKARKLKLSKGSGTVRYSRYSPRREKGTQESKRVIEESSPGGELKNGSKGCCFGTSKFVSESGVLV